MGRPAPDEDLITRYLDYEAERGGLRPSSVGPRRLYLRKYSREVGLVQQSPEALRAWLDRGLEPQSRNGWLAMIHGFNRWALRNGIVTSDPTEIFDREPVEHRPPVAITEEALELAIAKADETMRCWLVLAAYAGCSPQEIAGVTRDDLIANANYPYLRIRQGKRGRERLVMLDPRVEEAIAALEEQLTPDEPLWTVEPQPCSRAINHYLQIECGIASTASQLRHRFAFLQLEVSADLLEAQRAVGHALPGSTLAYVPESMSPTARLQRRGKRAQIGTPN